MQSSAKLGNAKAKRTRPALAKIAAVPSRQAGAGIDPTLKAFIDRVIVPALVQEYLAELRSENPLAAKAAAVAQCSTTSVEGTR